MVELTYGFKLFQPWANDVVKGKMKYILRKIPTKKRGRVAVIASKGLDGIWMTHVDDNHIKKVENKVGVIGSVEIKECIEVKPNNVKEQLTKLAGEDYWDYYPKHLIPKKSQTGKAYIWVFDKSNEWDKPISFKGGGITWAKMNMDDK